MKVISKSSFLVFEYSRVLCVMRVLYILDFSVSLCENKSSAVIQKGENILNIEY